jgi:hypothetical protein
METRETGVKADARAFASSQRGGRLRQAGRAPILFAPLPDHLHAATCMADPGPTARQIPWHPKRPVDLLASRHVDTLPGVNPDDVEGRSVKVLVRGGSTAHPAPPR